ncbi:MOXD1 homolog 1-like [Littorina saxatilis]|uniref:Temptin n=1 Tax=Littorina saxatilis TaxID=31220 RepID=A0AAN9AKL5_9CAEN
MTPVRVICILLCVTVAQGYRMFADRIPNGQQVPHPCKPNVLWHGVGHFNVDGGGFRNPFGMDFDRAGRQWTEALCRNDSDGDGRTNGQELGDPDCVWKVGQIPHSTHSLSHPGICDPMDSPRCQDKKYDWGLFHNQREWMEDACKSSEFNCSAIHDQDVRTMTARLDLTAVPPQETTYICQIFEVDDVLNDYHMIAATPVINNSYILHHMVIFGCEDSVSTRSAFQCDMLPDPKCKMILTVWTLGLNGDCFHPNAGVRIGKNGIKKLAVQLHWNNPGLIDHYQDSSGLVLHYTPHLRHYDSSMFLLGNEHFIIPPRTPSTVVTSRCAPSCTRHKMNDTIYVTSAFNHMHYLGHKMRLEQFRNGALVRTITNDLIYDYDSPKMYFFNDPIPVEPGDELKTTCDYSSTYKATTTFYGESTAEEMCYAFMSFYPFQSMQQSPFCTTWGSISGCDPETYHGCLGQEEAKYYQDVGTLDIFHNVTSNCRPFGPCTTECMDTILTARASDPCLTSGDPWDRLVTWGLSRNENGRNFLASLESCEIELYKLANDKDIIH